MAFLDLSYPITNNIKEYPEDPKTELQYFKEADFEDSSTVSKLSISLHTGTHIDAPFHYFPKGKKITDYDISDFIGKGNILKLNEKVENTIEDIAIIKTGWSKYFGSDKYFFENPYLTEEFSEKLIENNVKGIAIDTCSVDKYGENIIHKKLLKNDIWIVENIRNLEKLDRKSYLSYFIPIKINAEASLARAFIKI